MTDWVAVSGMVGATSLALCGGVECLGAWKRGYSLMPLGYTLVWLLGEIFMLAYNYGTTNDPYLYFNYGMNVIFIVFILRYRLFPTKKKEVCDATEDKPQDV